MAVYSHESNDKYGSRLIRLHRKSVCGAFVALNSNKCRLVGADH